MTPLTAAQKTTAAIPTPTPTVRVVETTPEITDVSKASFKLAEDGRSIIASLPTSAGTEIRFRIGFDKFMAVISSAAAFANMHLTQLWDAIGGP